MGNGSPTSKAVDSLRNGNVTGVTVGSNGIPKGQVSASTLAAEVKKESQEIDIIADLMDKDYQVQLAKLVLAANIKAVDVSVSVEGVKGQSANSRADVLSTQLHQLWESTLPKMMESISRGRVAFEKVFEYDAENVLSIVRKLEPLPFKLTRMKLSDDGDFEGIELKSKSKQANNGKIDIDPNKSWWLSLDATSQEPHGRSRYIGAPYEVWKQRQTERKRRKQMIDRFVIRGGKAHVPPTAEDEKGEIVDVFEATERALESLYAGGTLFLSNERDKEGNYLYDFTEADAEMLDPNPIEMLIEKSDVRMLRAFGILEKTLIEGEAVGSFAMVKQQMLILFAVVEDILDQCIESFQKFVIDKIVELNWDTANAPRIVISYTKLSNQPDSLAMKLLDALIESPQFVDAALSGGIDLRQLFEGLGFPVTEELEARLTDAVEKATASSQTATLQRRFDSEAGFDGIDFSNDSGRGVARSLAVTLPGTQTQVPDWESVRDAAMNELDSLYIDLFDLSVSLHSLQGLKQLSVEEQIIVKLREIRELELEARQASNIVGMLSPWRPSLQSLPVTNGRDLPQQPVVRDFAVHDLGLFDFIKRIFTFSRDAIAFLADKRIVTTEEYDDLSRRERAEVLGEAATADERKFLETVRHELSDSLRAGESFQSFRKRVGNVIDGSKSQTETVFRTNTKQAYVSGKETTLAKPHVRRRFPYVLYVSTIDPRRRHKHELLEGFVVEQGTPEHRVLQNAVRDWNCRCDLIPLTERQAQQRRIKRFVDLPGEVVAYYG